MSAPELKPCPFCGETPRVMSGVPGCAWIKCQCGAETTDGSIPRIISIWNTRTDLTIRRDDPVLVQVVEALRLYSCDDGCNDCTKPEQDRVCCGMTASLALAALKALIAMEAPHDRANIDTEASREVK